MAENMFCEETQKWAVLQQEVSNFAPEICKIWW